MNDFKKKFLRKVRAKLRRVKQEHEETEVIFERACIDFSQAIGVYCNQNKLKSPFDKKKDKEKDKINNKEVFADPEVKDLYKKIALSTHPDKLIHSNEENKEEKVELFSKAAKAKSLSDLGTLAEVALELKMNLNELKFEQIEILEEQVRKKEEATDEMRSSLAWVWYYSNKENRLKLIKSVFNIDDRG